PREIEKSLCSIFSACGRISLTENSSVVCPIIRCCSEKSSGVKTSAVCRSSNRKLPPEILVLGIAVVAMVLDLEIRTAKFKIVECGDITRRHHFNAETRRMQPVEILYPKFSKIPAAPMPPPTHMVTMP